MWIWLLLALTAPSSSRVRGATAEYWVSVSERHTALSGALEVLYGGGPGGSPLRLLLFGGGVQQKALAARDVPAKMATGRVLFPCATFQQPGTFLFRLVTADQQEKVVAESKQVSVQWPEVTVHVPLMVETYSSNVTVRLYVPTLSCKPRGSSTFKFFADLVYEGSSAWQQSTVLTSRELIGWAWQSAFDVILDCEFFDRAGNYTVKLRSQQLKDVIAVSDTILVMWSHRYSVSVAKSSVQPCDGSLSVIYHYPRCIRDQDRIRVYGKALRGPLKYIRESRIENGKHSTKLSCDIFQDEYQEYCFSFVSTARNGAVFDLKTHCLPSLTDSKGLIATWNDWSPWSECSSTCGSGGLQTRYRLCVSPMNSSDCVGKAVQTESCKKEDCPAVPTEVPSEEPQLWDCQCGGGCSKNLSGDPLLLKLHISDCDDDAEATWLVQAWPAGHLVLEILTVQFPSADHWLTIRDGASNLGAVLSIVGPLTTPVLLVHSLTDTVRFEAHVSNTSFIEVVFSITRSESPRESLAMVGWQKPDSASPHLSAVHLTLILVAGALCSSTVFLVLYHFCRRVPPPLSTTPDLLTSTSELSLQTTTPPGPEDYLYNSFLFRSSASLPKLLKWDKLPPKQQPSSSTPVRRRAAKPSAPVAQRESATPLTASVSELSTATGSDDGLEYDYYDYGCHQEPGSFFCPDPVLLGWPPFIPLPPQGMEEFGDYPLQNFTPSPEPS